MRAEFEYRQVTVDRYDCRVDTDLFINTLNEYGALGYEVVDINREDPECIEVIFKRMITDDNTDKLLNQLWKTLSKQ